MNEITRRQRIQQAEKYLHKNKIPFERKNCGYHLIIRSHHKVINYWPSSLKYAYSDEPNKIYQGSVDQALNIIYKPECTDIRKLMMKDLNELTLKEAKLIIYHLSAALNRATNPKN